VLVWSPLAGGLLSGKYRRDSQPPASSAAGRTANPRRGQAVADSSMCWSKSVRHACLGSAGGACLAARPASRQLAGDRRAPTRRSSRTTSPLRRSPSPPRSANAPMRSAGRCAVPLLAPAVHCKRPVRSADLVLGPQRHLTKGTVEWRKPLAEIKRQDLGSGSSGR